MSGRWILGRPTLVPVSDGGDQAWPSKEIVFYGMDHCPNREPPHQHSLPRRVTSKSPSVHISDHAPGTGAG